MIDTGYFSRFKNLTAPSWGILPQTSMPSAFGEQQTPALKNQTKIHTLNWQIFLIFSLSMQTFTFIHCLMFA